MKIFELHFNPERADDLIFDSFCYEPANVYEKRLGSLFLVGELKNVLPQNARFFDNLANFLKKQYYSLPGRFSPEADLKETLKRSNEFLEKIMKSGDVSWLGNLNSVVFNLVLRHGKWWEINLTKTGTMKILLLRGGETIDMGKNLELQDIEPYPLKVFGNLISGKLNEGDIILVLTKDVFSVFAESQGVPAALRKNLSKKKGSNRPPNIIEQIAGLSLIDGSEGRKIKEILKIKERELLETAGICLVCGLTKEAWLADKKPKIFTFQSEREKFSLSQVFEPMADWLKNVKLMSLKQLTKLRGVPEKLFKSRKSKTKAKLKKPKIKISLRAPWIAFPESFKKNVILVSFLIFFLFSGFFVSRREEQTKLKEYRAILAAAKEDISLADGFLILGNEKESFVILKNSWGKILPLAERKSAIQKEAASLLNSLEGKLEEISGLEKIPDPELFFEFDKREFAPERMAYFEENLYFYNPFAENVYKLTENAEKSVLSTDHKFNKAAPVDDSLLFFKKPDSIFLLKNDRLGEPLSLLSPFSDFNPKDLAVYQSNLYFVDGKNGEIVKYPGPITQGKDSPQMWLNPATKKAADAKSMAVNGDIWILDNNNSISRYFGGNFQNSLEMNFFPFPEDFSKMTSQFEYLYLLEPAQKRLVILNRSGDVLKQFQSEKFDNLKDFAVSENGRTIWLLNGAKVYQIKF